MNNPVHMYIYIYIYIYIYTRCVTIKSPALKHLKLCCNIKEIPILLQNVGRAYVLYGSQNKQRLFPYTALTDWFL